MKSLYNIVRPFEEQRLYIKETLEKRIQYCDREIENIETEGYSKRIEKYSFIKEELIQKRKQAVTILRSEELIKRYCIISLQQQINEIIRIFQIYGQLSDLRDSMIKVDHYGLMSALELYGLEFDWSSDMRLHTLDDLRQILYQEVGLECIPATAIEQLRYGYYTGSITEQEYEKFCQKAGIEKAGMVGPITVRRIGIDHNTIMNLKEGTYPKPLCQKKKTL